jgi:hypothetical protein
MKLNYDLIKKNLATYAEAKELFPVISDYERGEVNINVMRSLGLQDFAEFYDFLKRGDVSRHLERDNLIDDGITWRKLKLMIAESTDNIRLKKFIMNRTQKQFNEILMDGPQFDRLLNGRWVSKPSLTRRGRMSYGRRSNECVDGFKKSFIPLFNYIIQNNIDVYEDSKEYVYKKFVQQDSIVYFIRWYTTFELNFDNVPKREIDVTRKLLNTFVEIMEETKIDFRKLNSDYIISSISNKIKSSMIVTPGTMLKCLKDVPFGVKKSLIANNSYQVKSSRLDVNGYLQVYVTDELNRDISYPYSYFEDMAFHRDDLLTTLFG